MLMFRIATLTPGVAIFLFGAWSLVSVLQRRQLDPEVIPFIPEATVIHETAATISASAARFERVREPWPALFGEQIEMTIATPASSDTSRDPIPTQSHSYLLLGLLLDGSTSRAILEVNGSTTVAAVGDELIDGVILIAIEWGGVTISEAGREVHVYFMRFGREVSGFEPQSMSTVAHRAITPVDQHSAPSPQAMQFGGYEPDESSLLIYSGGLADIRDLALPWHDDPGFPP